MSLAVGFRRLRPITWLQHEPGQNKARHMKGYCTLSRATLHACTIIPSAGRGTWSTIKTFLKKRKRRAWRTEPGTVGLTRKQHNRTRRIAWHIIILTGWNKHTYMPKKQNATVKVARRMEIKLPQYYNERKGKNKSAPLTSFLLAEVILSMLTPSLRFTSTKNTSGTATAHPIWTHLQETTRESSCKWY